MNESPQVSGEAIEIDPRGSASIDLREEMERERLRIEAALEELLAPGGGPDDGRCPERLADAMRYSLMAGGKRLRPLLTLWAADACGAAAGSAMPAAVALEMIHT